MSAPDFYEAVEIVNDATEHRYGLGPIEDGGKPRERAISAARRVARTSAEPWRGQILQACATVAGMS